MESSESLYEMHALFRGRVQGVGFRITVRCYALELGLQGTVRNLPDGSVEIYAQGARNRLNELIEKLKQQFPLAVITAADIDYYPISQKGVEFRILP